MPSNDIDDPVRRLLALELENSQLKAELAAAHADLDMAAEFQKDLVIETRRLLGDQAIKIAALESRLSFRRLVSVN